MSEALDILHELEKLFGDERKAVASYDVAAIARIGAAKEDAARRLKTARIGDAVRFRAAAQRVSALAEANAAMFSASLAAVTDALGLRPAVTTYDSRARLRQRSTSGSARMV